MSSSTVFLLLSVLFAVLVWVCFVSLNDVKVTEEVHEKPNRDVFIKSVAIKKLNAIEAEIIKPRNIDVQTLHPSRNRTEFKSANVVKLYNEIENSVSELSVTWAEFLLLPREKIRSQQKNIDPKVLKSLSLCSNELAANLSTNLGGKDFEWCKWTLSATGGNVKIGESFGMLSIDEQERFDRLGCHNIHNGKSFSCDDERGDSLIQSWRRNRVKGLCEKNAESKLNCYDSPGGSRFCNFENAMMNFKRMRKKTRANGTPSRSWEQGFLSTSCGEKAKEDIGYFQIYKPDIDGSSDAVCDFVFNETVVAYSHDNINSFSHIFSDHLNVQSLLWLSGSASYSKDVSFLNIDALQMQRCFDDNLSEYFSYYSKAFRRILKAADFGTSSKVCFKNLIMQPKPEISFTRDGWKQDLRCPLIGPSTIYQRWNLEMRDNSGLLNIDTLQTNEIFTILLISKASKLGSRISGKNKKLGETSSIFATDKSPSGQGIGNINGVQTMLTELVDSISIKNTDIFIEIITQDFDLISFEEQVLLIAKSSLVIGLHGTGIALSMHMAVGTKYCCGVIEIFPSERRDKKTNGTNDVDLKIKKDYKFKNVKGHENMVRRMGIQYERLHLMGGVKSNDNERTIPNKVVESGDKLGVAIRLLKNDEGERNSINNGNEISESNDIGTNCTLSGEGVIRSSDMQNKVISNGFISNTKGINTDNMKRNLASNVANNEKDATGIYISPSSLQEKINNIIERILVKPSCFLPAVVKKKL